MAVRLVGHGGRHGRDPWQLPSKTWFAVLLLLGIFNVGFLAMVAYLIAGPDGRRPDAQPTALAPVGA